MAWGKSSTPIKTLSLKNKKLGIGCFYDAVLHPKAATDGKPNSIDLDQITPTETVCSG